jgi:hypothetical protein
MGNLIIKPNTGGELKLQDDGGTDAIKIDTSGGVSGTAILDEDNLATDSATQLATQQSIKAYVDLKAPVASPTFTGTVDLTGTTVSLDDDEISLDKVNGGTLGTGTIGGSSVVNTSGAITTTGVLTTSGGFVADLERFDTDALLLTQSISSTGALSTGTLTLTSTQAPLNSIAIVMMHTNERSSGSGAAYFEMHQNTNDANKVGIGIVASGWNHQYATMHMPIVVSGDRVIAHSGTVDVAGGANNFDIYYVGYYRLATT